MSLSTPLRMDANLPLMEEAKQFELQEIGPDNMHRQYLLIVEPLGENQMRWLLLDPLGVPISRQIWQEGHWKNDGFVPPAGDEIRQVFLASLSLLLSQEERQAVFPELSFVSEDHGRLSIIVRKTQKPWATVTLETKGQVFDFNQGRQWRIRLLENL